MDPGLGALHGYDKFTELLGIAPSEAFWPPNRSWPFRWRAAGRRVVAEHHDLPGRDLG